MDRSITSTKYVLCDILLHSIIITSFSRDCPLLNDLSLLTLTCECSRSDRVHIAHDDNIPLHMVVPCSVNPSHLSDCHAFSPGVVLIALAVRGGFFIAKGSITFSEFAVDKNLGHIHYHMFQTSTFSFWKIPVSMMGNVNSAYNVSKFRAAWNSVEPPIFRVANGTV